MPTIPQAARRLAVIAVAGLAILTVVAVHAQAHPFGPPPTAVLSADGAVVFVEWTATPDDLILVGERLGYLPPGSTQAYLESPAQVAPSSEDEDALMASPELRDYLLQRIVVRQEGQACPGTVEPVGSFLLDGARVSLTCPAPVGLVEVEITMLSDVDPRYRTFGVAAQEQGTQRAVFTAAEPRRPWSFSAGTTGAGPSSSPERDGGAGLGLFEAPFVSLIDTPLRDPLAAVTAAALAVALGAGHALAPGHAKAVAAAYLAGERGRPRDALVLGAVVAFVHGASALALGLVFVALERTPELLGIATPLLGLVGACLVVAVGLSLLVRGVRVLRAGRRGDPQAPGHPHLAPGATPGWRRDSGTTATQRTLLAVGAGLLPSPSAFLVISTALFAGRAAYGVGLLAAFSLGVGATVAGVGLAALHGRAVVERRAGSSSALRRVASIAPLVGAAVVTVGGLVLAVGAVQRL